jgi:hypothetical protein
MYATHRQEQFSNAYVSAVAAVAGFATYIPQPDIDSIDLGIADKGSRGIIRSPNLHLQIKAPYRHNVINTHTMSYSLKKKNYDDLRHIDFHIPRILIVVILADDINDWLYQSDQELIMRHCAYWTSLRGKPELPFDKETKSVSLSKEQFFNVEGLQNIMDKISNGENLS